jgi:hypothetical protein
MKSSYWYIPSCTEYIAVWPSHPLAGWQDSRCRTNAREPSPAHRDVRPRRAQAQRPNLVVKPIISQTCWSNRVVTPGGHTWWLASGSTWKRTRNQHSHAGPPIPADQTQPPASSPGRESAPPLSSRRPASPTDPPPAPAPGADVRPYCCRERDSPWAGGSCLPGQIRPGPRCRARPDRAHPPVRGHRRRLARLPVPLSNRVCACATQARRCHNLVPVTAFARARVTPQVIRVTFQVPHVRPPTHPRAPRQSTAGARALASLATAKRVASEEGEEGVGGE